MSSSKKRNALGKGLSALLNNEETDVTSIEPRALNSVADIPISQIVANPFQPRTEFDEEALQELSESIKVHGLVQPITVRKVGYEKYEIISGERRTRASILAGLKKIPAYIRLANDQEMLEMALVENIQRENLNAMEIAISYQRLADECGLKHEELGERVGKNRSTVNNYLRLLRLPEVIQAAIKEGNISMGHARALINVDDEELRNAIYRQIIQKGLSVRQVEHLVKQSREGSTKNKGSKSSSSSVTYAEEQEKLSVWLNHDVKIKADDKGKGVISIPFQSEEQLKELMDRFGD
jgi:ParB family chromosome partitioning protein